MAEDQRPTIRKRDHRELSAIVFLCRVQPGHPAVDAALEEFGGDDHLLGEAPLALGNGTRDERVERLGTLLRPHVVRYELLVARRDAAVIADRVLFDDEDW